MTFVCKFLLQYPITHSYDAYSPDQYSWKERREQRSLSFLLLSMCYEWNRPVDRTTVLIQWFIYDTIKNESNVFIILFACPFCFILNIIHIFPYQSQIRKRFAIGNGASINLKCKIYSCRCRRCCSKIFFDRFRRPQFFIRIH